MPLVTGSSSLISVAWNLSSSLVVETLKNPSGSFFTFTLPVTSSISGLQTLTTSGFTLTVKPITVTSGVSSTASTSTSDVETFTEPGGSSIVLTLPTGTTLTGVNTITTDRSTLTVAPVSIPTDSATITSTMVTLPSRLSVEHFTRNSVTANSWLTTTGSDHSTTIIPIIYLVRRVYRILFGTRQKFQKLGSIGHLFPIYLNFTSLASRSLASLFLAHAMTLQDLPPKTMRPPSVRRPHLHRPLPHLVAH
ncbi:hypothetical protein CJF31_00008119 [Rutstroemia sp. NJR-2017a BVV2]|nr:hypothetical protein CJF31_00008119 [Rutstroemia sp. NJR-2017a BVV2]